MTAAATNEVGPMPDRAAIESTIRAYATAWAARDRAAWLGTFSPSATQEDPVGGAVLEGVEAIGGFWDRAMADYTAIEILPREIFVVGRQAAMVWTINGTRSEGPVTFHGVDVFEFDDHGRITSVRAFWERDLLLEQIRGPRARDDVR